MILFCWNVYFVSSCDLVMTSHRYHMSPLLLASYKGKCALVTELLRAGCDVNKQDSRGWSVSGPTCIYFHLIIQAIFHVHALVVYAFPIYFVCWSGLQLPLPFLVRHNIANTDSSTWLVHESGVTTYVAAKGFLSYLPTYPHLWNTLCSVISELASYILSISYFSVFIMLLRSATSSWQSYY